MADDTTPVATPAVAPGSTPAQAATTTTTTPPAGDEQDTISLDEARKLRREAQELRRRIKAYDDAQAAAEAAKLSETERLQKEYADLQASNEDLAAALMEANVNQDVARLSAKFNFAVSPDLLARLLDWSEMEWDEETGKATNLERMLEKLAKASPELIRGHAPNPGGATNPSRSATTGTPALSWEVITAMTPQQYAARQQEIQAWMRRNPPRGY